MVPAGLVKCPEDAEGARRRPDVDAGNICIPIYAAYNEGIL